MKLLYAPWRSNYVQGVTEKKREETSPQDCVFCTYIADDHDEEHFIFRRFTHHIIMLNIYPYNAGHLLIVSCDHVKSLNNLSQEARGELIELTNGSIEILTKALGTEGINIGMNLGKAAGAGIPAHFHEHILPRWAGDTNFLPLLAETKQISMDLKKMYRDLKPHFDALK